MTSVPVRIVVTGGGGFLGAYMLRRLRTAWPEARLMAMVRSVPQTPISGVEYVREFQPADVIFHLAGSTGIGRSIEDPAADLEGNILLALDTFEFARRHGCRQVVLASTAAVYGHVKGRVDEEHPLAPASPYGLSKAAAEGYARAYTRLYGLDCRIARIANTYGPGQQRLVVYDLARQAASGHVPLHLRGTGEEVRDFIHAADVASALDVISREGGPGEVYNVASGRAVTIRTVAERIARLAGLPLAIEAQKSNETARIDEFRPSTAKLEALGFTPAVDLDAGLAETLAWVTRADAWLQRGR